MNKLTSISPLTKLGFLMALLVLGLWVIPTMVSFYKNQKIYNQKVELLNTLDHREGAQLEAKTFHSEVFRHDAEQYFDKVEVSSVADDDYEVILDVDPKSLDQFHTFLRNLSMDYAVKVEDGVHYHENNGSMRIKMILKPLI